MARVGGGIAFGPRLTELQRHYGSLTATVSLSRDNGDMDVNTRVARGRLSVNRILEDVGGTDAVFCLCATAEMMAAIRDGLVAAGIVDGDIHSEAFGAGTARPQASGEGSFSIRLARTGSTVAWRPERDTLLDLLEDEGIPINSGCRAGQCGSCAVSLVSGAIDYLGATDAMADNRCLARPAVPKADLVIDA